MDCLFCKIAHQEIECKILYEDEDFFVFLDLDQSTPGHTLIITKQHYKDYTELDEATLKKLFLLANKISHILMNRLHKNGISLVFNYGELLEVKHVHLHLFPKEAMKIDEVYSTIKDEI